MKILQHLLIIRFLLLRVLFYVIEIKLFNFQLVYDMVKFDFSGPIIRIAICLVINSDGLPLHYVIINKWILLKVDFTFYFILSATFLTSGDIRKGEKYVL